MCRAEGGGDPVHVGRRSALEHHLMIWRKRFFSAETVAGPASTEDEAGPPEFLKRSQAGGG